VEGILEEEIFKPLSDACEAGVKVPATYHSRRLKTTARCSALVEGLESNITRHLFVFTRQRSIAMLGLPSRFREFCHLLGSLCLLLTLTAMSHAGGGPENVLLVVNALSEDSRTVANHYIDLRKIPPSNVVFVNSPPLKGMLNAAQYRKRILAPVDKAIEERGLKNQIDYVVFSCDFPWQINFLPEYPGEKFPRGFRPLAGISSAMYLSEFIRADRKEFMSVNSNFYAAPPSDLIVFSRGFRSGYRWGIGGRRAGQEGLSYMLSAVLGVTQGRGNTVSEIIWYLERAAQADGTAPKGTIYFAKNSNIRSTTRDTEFPAAVRFLGIAGVRAEIFPGIFPTNKQDMAGVTCGFNVINPAQAKSRFLPGAICDNLTSLGGEFSPKNQQTVVSEFLRLGAAGACGTVVEPTALRQKFPYNSLHVHYANGCSLAESFYQSVACTFQQILVGDPLCQPWAKAPKVSVTGITDGGTIRDRVEIIPTAQAANGGIALFQLYVDGILNKQCRVGERFELSTIELADGYHEVRVVAIDGTPIETQGRWIGTIQVKNGTDAVQLSANQSTLAASSKMLTVNVTATNGGATTVFCNGVSVGEVASGNGPLSMDRSKLGTGPVTLIAVTEGKPQLRSRPLRVVLERQSSGP
jgi:uncharacterized protein (TIGR03790 family)